MKLKSSATHFSARTLQAVFILFLSLPFAYGQLTEIENQIPKRVPLKIEFKNYDSDNWVHDLEIVVTNESKKPIYFLFFALTLDVKAEDGNVRGFPITFGNGDWLGSTEALARPDEEFIAPGEVYTFRIDEKSAKAWNLRKTHPSTAPLFVEPRKGYLELGWMSFGDGSGFQGGGVPFRKKGRTR